MTQYPYNGEKQYANSLSSPSPCHNHIFRLIPAVHLVLLDYFCILPSVYPTGLQVFYNFLKSRFFFAGTNSFCCFQHSLFTVTGGKAFNTRQQAHSLVACVRLHVNMLPPVACHTVTCYMLPPVKLVETHLAYVTT